MLVSLRTPMKIIYSYRISTSVSNLFKQFMTTTPDLQLHKLFLPRVNSSQGQCSLKLIGPNIWSEIPDHVKLWFHFDFKQLHKICLLSQLDGAKQQWNLFIQLIFCYSFLCFRTLGFFLLLFLWFLCLTGTVDFPFLM